MKKVAIVYWSGTGNTLAMANEIADELKNSDLEAEVINCSSFSEGDVANYDGFAFGCPAMGSEELEEGEYNTLNGYIINQLGEIPKSNEKVEIKVDNVNIEVIKVSNKKIEKVKVSYIN